VDGKSFFVREGGKTQLHGKAEFTLDWHHIGLPLISIRNDSDPIAVFRTWLSSILYLDPTPAQILPTSKEESPYLQKHLVNLVDWIRYHLSLQPALYGKVERYLREWMSDFDSFKLEVTGREEREFLFTFKDQKAIELSLTKLADGEKTYLLTALLLAIISSDRPMLCLWDEADQFIALPELSYFITACRKAFEATNGQAQLILTSHNARVMYEFSGHNCFVLSRSSHLQPTRLERMQDKTFLSPDPVQAYENGELD
jgi:predicted ATPase